jgi:hypothetical protein
MRTNIRFCKDSRGVIKFPAVSMRPRDPIRFRREIQDNRLQSSDPAVSMRPRDPNFANDYLDFLGENEAICKTALGRESGP